ncbi:hypothetical protein Ccrd_018622, partial [Cynara cardunculus var. scolymus]
MRTFFMACPAHNIRRNDLNQYCIDCEMAACQHCRAEGTHHDHRIITIYRLVYREVVSLEEMNRYLDCSRIQPYMSNGREVLALHPLPHCGSGSLKQHIACRFCTRKLMDPRSYQYCSIACKYQIDGGRPTTIEPPARPPASNNGDGDNGGAGGGSAAAGGSRNGKTASHHRSRK